MWLHIALLHVVSNRQFLSLLHMDGESWNWDTHIIQWKLKVDDLNLWSVWVINTSRKKNSCSFSMVNCDRWTDVVHMVSDAWTSSWEARIWRHHLISQPYWWFQWCGCWCHFLETFEVYIYQHLWNSFLCIFLYIFLHSKIHIAVYYRDFFVLLICQCFALSFLFLPRI